MTIRLDDYLYNQCMHNLQSQSCSNSKDNIIFHSKIITAYKAVYHAFVRLKSRYIDCLWNRSCGSRFSKLLRYLHRSSVATMDFRRESKIMPFFHITESSYFTEWLIISKTSLENTLTIMGGGLLKL